MKEESSNFNELPLRERRYSGYILEFFSTGTDKKKMACLIMEMHVPHPPLKGL